MAKHGRELAEQRGDARQLEIHRPLRTARAARSCWPPACCSICRARSASCSRPIARFPRRIVINTAAVHPEHQFFTVNSLGTAFCPPSHPDAGRGGARADATRLSAAETWINPDKPMTIPFAPTTASGTTPAIASICRSEGASMRSMPSPRACRPSRPWRASTFASTGSISICSRNGPIARHASVTRGAPAASDSSATGAAIGWLALRHRAGRSAGRRSRRSAPGRGQHGKALPGRRSGSLPFQSEPQGARPDRVEPRCAGRGRSRTGRHDERGRRPGLPRVSARRKRQWNAICRLAARPRAFDLWTRK